MENQDIEYKATWRDEYLQWICGFANTQGGTVYVGIDDGGRVVGLENADRLLEDIPNKIVSTLGISAYVMLHTAIDGRQYLEVTVEPQAFPVSCKGLQIRVYEDRLRIGNACILPEGWTMDDLLGFHGSEPHNPKIAHVFFLAGLVESWGRGVQNIFTACKMDGIDPPLYRMAGNSLQVVFSAPEERLVRSARQGDADNVPVNVPVNDTEKGAEIAYSAQSANVRRQMIIRTMCKNPHVTISMLADELHVTTRTIRRDIRALREEGRVERLGSDKAGTWKAIPLGSEGENSNE